MDFLSINFPLLVGIALVALAVVLEVSVISMGFGNVCLTRSTRTSGSAGA